MQRIVTEMIEHMSHSHEQLARVLEAKRHVAVRMAQIVHALPDTHPGFGGVNELMDNSQMTTKSIVNYLHSIAELQESLAQTISAVMREIDVPEDEE
ncbi:nucleoside-diphosphate sugar epimerase [Paenibacillus montanisoli]|uniref:Nucleoside-diphosphate sugar epimerase n=1 Tax=Paenibacillus montanisoli TaxID=2081970 RepID=A0A328U929_9BACL|nr:nucleoside-diphosphate sugar epimerase [Paenibacillus montanisoli]RAP77405.1 nucleoside-diphosphate sugar epimerase [Paenibacillus montanisoli]